MSHRPGFFSLHLSELSSVIVYPRSATETRTLQVFVSASPTLTEERASLTKVPSLQRARLTLQVFPWVGAINFPLACALAIHEAPIFSRDFASFFLRRNNLAGERKDREQIAREKQGFSARTFLHFSHWRAEPRQYGGLFRKGRG
jgi:hypothetical protein